MYVCGFTHSNTRVHPDLNSESPTHSTDWGSGCSMCVPLCKRTRLAQATTASEMIGHPRMCLRSTPSAPRSSLMSSTSFQSLRFSSTACAAPPSLRRYDALSYFIFFSGYSCSSPFLSSTALFSIYFGNLLSHPTQKAFNNNTMPFPPILM